MKHLRGGDEGAAEEEEAAGGHAHLREQASTAQRKQTHAWQVGPAYTTKKNCMTTTNNIARKTDIAYVMNTARMINTIYTARMMTTVYNMP